MKEAAVPVGVGDSPLTFEAFFQREYASLAAALYLLTGSRAEAEDLTQEAMAKVLERWERVRTMESPVGYLYRTAFNLNRKRLRWLRRLPPQPATPFLYSNDPEGIVADRNEIVQMLEALPPAQREVLVLVESLGFTPAEVAAMYRMKPGTVRARLSRAKATIRAKEIEPNA